MYESKETAWVDEYQFESRINDPDDIASWVGKGSEIPNKYLIFALNPSHIPSEYRKEYDDCLDVWIEAEDECNGSRS